MWPMNLRNCVENGRGQFINNYLNVMVSDIFLLLSSQLQCDNYFDIHTNVKSEVEYVTDMSETFI